MPWKGTLPACLGLGQFPIFNAATSRCSSSLWVQSEDDGSEKVLSV